MHLRVGAANAGHTLYTITAGCVCGNGEAEEDRGAVLRCPIHGPGPWEKHVMQQLPCAAYANPDASLFIGPGALITPTILKNEVERWQKWRSSRALPFRQVLVDRRAQVITSRHVQIEQESDLAERIGSTSTIAKEGIGAAQAARVMRDSECITAWDYYGPNGQSHIKDCVRLLDVPTFLGQSRDRDLLLEGTQGAGLSLTTGFFPYVTSRNTTVAGLCADAGVAPTTVDRVILVCRTFPIRVAGNSGPFWKGSREIGWEEVGIDSESERTTVTKKVRRVATFSLDQVREAAMLNGATEIVLMFCDYLSPGLSGLHGSFTNSDLVDCGEVMSLVHNIELGTGVPVRYLGTGPHSMVERVTVPVTA